MQLIFKYRLLLPILIFLPLIPLWSHVDTFRNPVEHPFFSTSIWNMPIGNNADYKPANLRTSGHVGADIVHVLQLDSVYPARQVLGHGTFGPGRCQSIVDIDLTLNVPDDWIIPDAGNSPFGGTPNSSFAIIDEAGERVFQGQVIARCEAGGPIYLPDWMQYPANRQFNLLASNGLASGTGHGASRMSVIGGLIRKGEFASPEPIDHAIKINPYAAVDLHYSAAVPGYRWPATQADFYADELYNRNADPDLVMGSLLAIPPDITAESLGLDGSPAALKFFYTMQNYGVYFVEDAAYDTWDVVLERDAEREFEDVYGYTLGSNRFKRELNTLMGALHVITNNRPGSIGGGGTPLVPLTSKLEFEEPDFGVSIISAIPGRVEAEHYQVGGEGIAYTDRDATNNGGVLRPDDGVDLENTTDEGGGANLGWTEAGEWVFYSVDVAEAGTYQVNFRSAAGDATLPDLTIEVTFSGNGASTGDVVLPFTGGWQNWQNTAAPITLQAGQQNMRINIVAGGFNLNYLEFEKTTGTAYVDAGMIGLSLAPNPTRGDLNVRLAADVSGADFQIVDTYGRVVRAGTLSGERTDLSVSDLPAGVYQFLVLTRRGVRSRAKFVVGGGF